MLMHGVAYSKTRAFFNALFAIRDTGILVALPERIDSVSKVLDKITRHIEHGLANDSTKPASLDEYLTGRPLKKVQHPLCRGSSW